MLEKIRCIYLRKDIVSFITEKKKLKLLKYNKRTQKLLNIDLKNYILFKRKFVICDKSGIAKEYDFFSGKLLFVGEYLNGERYGKGREYSYFNDEENLINVEQYLKNKLNDYGILFEGEYLNGERNGKGKEYDWSIFVWRRIFKRKEMEWKL